MSAGPEVCESRSSALSQLISNGYRRSPSSLACFGVAAPCNGYVFEDGSKHQLRWFAVVAVGLEREQRRGDVRGSRQVEAVVENLRGRFVVGERKVVISGRFVSELDGIVGDASQVASDALR